MRRNYLVVGRSLVLAILIVSSLVVPFAGTASAATIYNDTVTGAPKYIVVDGADVSGDFTIEMSVSGAQLPGQNSDEILLRETVGDGSAIQNFAFLNSGAYESVDVEVTVPDTSTGSPTIGDGSGLMNFQLIGSAGGDANLDCGLAESINNYAVTYGAGIVDCSPSPTQGINTTKLNGNETKLEIYQTAAQTSSTREVAVNSWNNYRTGMENDAIIAGKNEYVRQLVNGSTESVARSRARSAVRDYWARQQINLLEQWNGTASTIMYVKDKAEGGGGVNGGYVNFHSAYGGWDYEDGTVAWGTAEGSAPLVNSTSHGVTYVHAFGADGHDYEFHPLSDTSFMTSAGGFARNVHTSKGIYANEAPYENGREFVAKRSAWVPVWADMKASSSSTVSEVDTFANNTYESYQSGDINTSDLIDPYMARSELGPNNGSEYQTWALTSISGLDSSTPDTLENTGSMTVVGHGTDSQVKSTWTNTTYSGIILSQSLPANDTFEAGVTYNATQMSGGQYVVTDNKTVELTGLFTPETFTTVDGTKQQSVVYKNITYQTTTMQDYKDLMANLTRAQQDIDDRWDLLNAPADTSSGGGGAVLSDGFLSGLFDSLGFAGIPGEAVALGGGAAAAYGLTIRGGSGGFGGSRRRR